MAQIKLSAEQQKQFDERDAADRDCAFEVGFTKCAADIGLNEAEFNEFYKAGCQKLSANK